MPIHGNVKLLIDAIESTPLLNGRFKQLENVNIDLAADTRRGNFSVVFRGIDEATGKTVALKFYDPSPAAAIDQYRSDAFARESEILQTLLNQKRCLQLERSLDTYLLNLTGPAGTMVLPCRYFAVEWLADEIDAFFLAPSTGKPIDEAIIKLELFHKIVLAVQSLHQHEVFHRDLKHDNLRSVTRALQQVVVAIDLGTAARFNSRYIQAGYTHQVGAGAYAAPEAICGLAANREVAPLTDIYALGCFLFELFNLDRYFFALRAQNPDLLIRLGVMATHVTERTDEKVQLAQWHTALAALGSGVAPVPILSPGNTLPPGIATLVGELMESLTAFDYRRRNIGFGRIITRIQLALKVLKNDRAYQKRVAARRLRRAQRLAKQRAADARAARQKAIGAP